MVSITVNQTCSRCSRDNAVTYPSLEAATAAEKAAHKKAEGLKVLTDFVAKMDPLTVPDFVAIHKGKVAVSHETLCTGGGAKSDCHNSLTNHLELMGKLPPRKPRTPKAAAPIPLTNVAPDAGKA